MQLSLRDVSQWHMIDNFFQKHSISWTCVSVDIYVTHIIACESDSLVHFVISSMGCHEKWWRHEKKSTPLVVWTAVTWSKSFSGCCMLSFSTSYSWWTQLVNWYINYIQQIPYGLMIGIQLNHQWFNFCINWTLTLYGSFDLQQLTQSNHELTTYTFQVVNQLAA